MLYGILISKTAWRQTQERRGDVVSEHIPAQELWVEFGTGKHVNEIASYLGTEKEQGFARLPFRDRMWYYIILCRKGQDFRLGCMVLQWHQLFLKYGVVMWLCNVGRVLSNLTIRSQLSDSVDERNHPHPRWYIRNDGVSDSDSVDGEIAQVPKVVTKVHH